MYNSIWPAGTGRHVYVRNGLVGLRNDKKNRRNQNEKRDKKREFSFRKTFFLVCCHQLWGHFHIFLGWQKSIMFMAGETQLNSPPTILSCTRRFRHRCQRRPENTQFMSAICRCENCTNALTLLEVLLFDHSVSCWISSKPRNLRTSSSSSP